MLVCGDSEGFTWIQMLITEEVGWSVRWGTLLPAWFFCRPSELCFCPGTVFIVLRYHGHQLLSRGQLFLCVIPWELQLIESALPKGKLRHNNGGQQARICHTEHTYFCVDPRRKWCHDSNILASEPLMLLEITEDPLKSLCLYNAIPPDNNQIRSHN